jgi:RNA polymerase sigma-70 factor (ECF subfamily)
MTIDLGDLRDARARFLDLVRDLRPELHRYCARMTGSVIDGEDVLQDTLAHAYFTLSELESVPALRPWLFRIAHNRAIDFTRRYDGRMRAPLDPDAHIDESASAADALDERLAVRAAFASFSELPPSQRACVILKDVLGHSSLEIGEILGLGVAAVDACLHRGRRRLRAIARAAQAQQPSRPNSAVVEQYATLFQARDWDGVRALLANDVRLDLVGHARQSGAAVRKYFGNYGGLLPYRASPGWLEGREGLYIFQHPDDEVPAYFIELIVEGGAIAAIRDYRFVPYLLAEQSIENAEATQVTIEIGPE